MTLTTTLTRHLPQGLFPDPFLSSFFRRHRPEWSATGAQIPDINALTQKSLLEVVAARRVGPNPSRFSAIPITLTRSGIFL